MARLQLPNQNIICSSGRSSTRNRSTSEVRVSRESGRILAVIGIERVHRGEDLGEIVFRLRFSCPFIDGIRRRKEKASQNPDDTHDDEQLDERPAAKAAWPSSHRVTLPEPFELLQAFSLPRRQVLDDPKSYWPYGVRVGVAVAAGAVAGSRGLAGLNLEPIDAVAARAPASSCSNRVFKGCSQPR